MENVQKFLIYILFSGGQSSSVHKEFIFWMWSWSVVVLGVVCFCVLFVCLFCFRWFFLSIGKSRLQRRGWKFNHTAREGLSWLCQECQNHSSFPNTWEVFFSILLFCFFIKVNKNSQNQANCHKCCESDRTFTSLFQLALSLNNSWTSSSN